MDQISVFIESMRSIRDHDLRLIEGKQVVCRGQLARGSNGFFCLRLEVAA